MHEDETRLLSLELIGHRYVAQRRRPYLISYLRILIYLSLVLTRPEK